MDEFQKDQGPMNRFNSSTACIIANHAMIPLPLAPVAPSVLLPQEHTLSDRIGGICRPAGSVLPAGPYLLM